MKKLFLSSILALCAAASYAQNSATVAQNGTMNSASAIQSGSSLTATVSQVGATPTAVASNTGITNQTGTGHTATINQNGGSTFNRAYATQSNATGTTGANSATLSQSNGSGGTVARGGDRVINTVAGAGNFSGSFQVGSGNTAVVNQDGPASQGNLGEISQRGTNNTATTSQNNGATNNLAQTFQGYNLTDAGSNTATVNQDAAQRNEALVKQYSNGNTATLLQNTANSMDNKAFVTQGDGTGAAGQDGNIAAINQTGGARNTGTIMQTSRNAGASIYQSTQYNFSNDNEASINQLTGTGSQASISQAGVLSNTATVSQWGDGNYTEITQIEGGGPVKNSVATVNQGSSTVNGTSDKAFIYMNSNVYSGTATINQNQTVAGQSNFAQIDMSTTSLNLATISQEGSFNEAGVAQTGVGSNTATVKQNGDYNVVGGPSTGFYSGKSGDSYWAPHAHAGSALQNGSNNSMSVTQTATAGAGTASVFNDARLSQTGEMNILTVNQTVGASAMAGNMATATQTGMNNQAIVQQTAMP